jgi:hypothetical protein
LQLNELGLKHGTDKSTIKHNYLDAYEELLAPYHGVADLGLLEIGVRRGASLRMWQDFFPNARMVGIDLLKSCRQFVDDRTSIELGDQSDKDFLDSVVARHQLDIIIDDGSHIWSHQIDSFRWLFPHLRAGGIYICEDMHTSRADWVDRFGRSYSDTAATYFGRLAAEFCAEHQVYGTMADPELTAIREQIAWVRFGGGFVAIKKV